MFVEGDIEVIIVQQKESLHVSERAIIFWILAK